MTRRTRSALILAATLLAAGGARADLFRWTDESGRGHVTSNLEEVPARYRAQAQQSSKSTGTVNRASPTNMTNPASPERQRLTHLRQMNREPAPHSGAPLILGGTPPGPRPPSDEKPDHRYDTKCNITGDRCRRVQTQEFRDWKFRQKSKGEAPASDDD